MGYYPVEAGPAPYDANYFARFRARAETDIGRALMEFRCNFVGRRWAYELVDVGIGSGAFIERRRAMGMPTMGFDINPAAADWLKRKDLFCDPYRPRVSALSLWDVIEHIPDYRPLLRNVTRWLFVSLPIFKDGDHVLRSKHYRKDEHVWYFTRDGLVRAMRDEGFILVEESDQETRLGREDIGAFAFRRV